MILPNRLIWFCQSSDSPFALSQLRYHYQCKGRTKYRAEMSLKIDPVCSEQTNYCLFVQVEYWPTLISYQQTFLCSQGQHRSRHSNWQHVHKSTTHWRMRRQRDYSMQWLDIQQKWTGLTHIGETIQWFNFTKHYADQMHHLTVIQTRNFTFLHIWGFKYPRIIKWSGPHHCSHMTDALKQQRGVFSCKGSVSFERIFDSFYIVLLSKKQRSNSWLLSQSSLATAIYCFTAQCHASQR